MEVGGYCPSRLFLAAQSALANSSISGTAYSERKIRDETLQRTDEEKKGNV
jgi:hypothetical protein